MRQCGWQLIVSIRHELVINQQMHFTLPPSHPHPLHPLLIHMLTWVKLYLWQQQNRVTVLINRRQCVVTHG